jgi:hypothetical protein
MVRAFVVYARVCHWFGSKHSFLDECRKVYGFVSGSLGQG